MNTQAAGPIPRGSDSAHGSGLGISVSKFPGDVDRAGPGTTLGEQAL